MKWDLKNFIGGHFINFLIFNLGRQKCFQKFEKLDLLIVIKESYNKRFSQQEKIRIIQT